MKFCATCGHAVTVRIPDGDNLPRHVCDSCGTVHYRNPKIVAGCVAAHGDRILLCRRAIEPRHGLWTVPAGFMENGETTQAAAARETLEEACAEPEDLALFGLFNIPHINQVYLMFRARLREARHAPGAESLETALVAREDIPWDALAFPVVRRTLDLYFADLDRGSFGTHLEDMAPSRRT